MRPGSKEWSRAAGRAFRELTGHYPTEQQEAWRVFWLSILAAVQPTPASSKWLSDTIRLLEGELADERARREQASQWIWRSRNAEDLSQASAKRPKDESLRKRAHEAALHFVGCPTSGTF